MHDRLMATPVVELEHDVGPLGGPIVKWECDTAGSQDIGEGAVWSLY